MNKESMQKMERSALEVVLIMALLVSGTVAYSAEPEHILIAENSRSPNQNKKFETSAVERLDTLEKPIFGSTRKNQTTNSRIEALEVHLLGSKRTKGTIPERLDKLEAVFGGGRKEHYGGWSSGPLDIKPSGPPKAPEASLTNVDLTPYLADAQRRIKGAWCPPRGHESRRVEVIFKIHSQGEFSDLRLEKTSGVALADQAALAAVQNAAPFRPLPTGAPAVLPIKFTFDYNLLTGRSSNFAPLGPSGSGSDSDSTSGGPSAPGPAAASSGGSWSFGPITITASGPPKLSGTSQAEVDFQPYMADLQRRIKRAWFPPRGQESQRLDVIFKIHSEGELSDLRLKKSSGSALADQAAQAAVTNAAPFRPLPAGAPAVVAVQFTFDFNVFTGGRTF